MKLSKIILTLAALVGLCADASASPAFEIGYSSFAVVGVRCTSGTAVNVNASRPTGLNGNVAGYRIGNTDSADSAWFGGVSVSTTPASATASIANLGEELKAGASVAWPIGKDYGRGSVPLVPLYCKAGDDAGVNGVVLSVAWFTY